MYLKLILAFKVLNNHVFCAFVPFAYHPLPNLRINNNKQLLKPFAGTISFSYSYTLYLISTVKLWICLPSDIVACTKLILLSMP